MTLADQLLDQYPEHQVASTLNERGLITGWGKPFTAQRLRVLCKARTITSHHQRLRDTGMLTLNEIAAKLGVTTETIKQWRRLGLLTARRTDGRGTLLFHPHQQRPDRDTINAAHHPADAADLITGGKLADKLGVTRSTVQRWHELGLIEASRRDHRGVNLYHRDMQRPTAAQILATQRPPDTADLITGGKLADKLGLARSTVYKWYQLGLIHAVATDKTGRHLYRPGQQPPNPAQITAARLQARAATARSRTSTSRSGAIISARHTTSKDIESSTGGAV